MYTVKLVQGSKHQRTSDEGYCSYVPVLDYRGLPKWAVGFDALPLCPPVYLS